MRPNARMSFVITLGILLLFRTGAMAADLPKEGTWTAEFFAFGTWKGTPIGKTRFLGTFEENAVLVGNGLMDHMTAHCFGVTDRLDDMREFRANCVYTDLSGDQIVGDVSSNGKYPNDAKNAPNTVTFSTGTGKYVGISGVSKGTCNGSDYKAPTEGTFFSHCTGEGSYKLP